MNKRLYSCGVSTDLKKPFNTVDHTIFPGIMNTCFSYYPQDRTRTVQIGPHFSESTVSLCGVPQGSALGPLLFLYINGIYS